MAALVSTGCTGSKDSAALAAPESLVDHSLWTAVEADEDPFDDRIETVDCPTSSWAVEVVGNTASLEVDTGMCNYLCVSQQTLVAVAAGQEIEVVWSHEELTADEPTEGHIAIQLGDFVVWDSIEPIPSDPEDITHVVTAPEDIPEGTPAWVHVHNHGSNTWSVSEIRALPIDEAS